MPLPILLLRKRKLRHSLGRPSRSDFVQLEFIGINSIDFVKIVVDLEEYFEFEFDDEDLDYKKFEYITDICNYIRNITETK